MDKQGEFYHGMTPASHERHVTLAEEAGEVVQAIGKILRHGPQAHNPRKRSGYNKEDLEHEIGDFQAVVQFMIERGDLDGHTIQQAIMKKSRKLRDEVNNYFHHQYEDAPDAEA